MNKYQKALDKAKTYKNDFGIMFRTNYSEESILLQELVDKAAPIKVIFDNRGVPQCPRCQSYSSIHDGIKGKYRHCSDCGQALDWSETK
jgi:hypothetical protein